VILDGRKKVLIQLGFIEFFHSLSLAALGITGNDLDLRPLYRNNKLQRCFEIRAADPTSLLAL
jgi:hypothetical protein